MTQDQTDRAPELGGLIEHLRETSRHWPHGTYLGKEVDQLLLDAAHTIERLQGERRNPWEWTNPGSPLQERAARLKAMSGNRDQLITQLERVYVAEGLWFAEEALKLVSQLSSLTEELKQERARREEDVLEALRQNERTTHELTQVRAERDEQQRYIRSLNEKLSAAERLRLKNG